MAFNTTYVGTQIGNYRVTSQLASGGFGSVYLAQHVILSGRIAAFKVLHAVYLSAPHERESFFQEAQLLEKLKHAYILPILDVGLYQNMVPYIIAEYAQHGSLRERIRRENGRPLPIGAALTILSQVGEALQYAHQQNIIHRDLKPENILFNTQDIALLADFGIATALTTASVKVGQVAGTPLYMAPEQFRGMASKESDQYGLACIAYMKALSKERHDRYPSVTAFIAALRSPSGQPIPPSPPYPLRQVGGSPVHTPPIRDARQTPPLQNKGQNYAYPPGNAANQAVGTKPTGGDRTLAVLCYLSPLLLIAYGAGLILILICYFAGRKRPFVRFHFMQALIFFILSAIIFFIGAAASSNSGTDAINNTLGTIFFSYVGLSILYMILAVAGKRTHIPIIGGLADKYANRQPKGAKKIS